MSEWAIKRFWKSADIRDISEGFSVALDGRPVKTPAKNQLVVPTEKLARRIAEEWQAVDEKIDPMAMPFTRSANAAIDKVAVQQDEVAEMVAGYAETDLLCYRADSPEALVRRQAEAWDGYLDWAARAKGLKLTVASGVMPVSQKPETLAAARAHTARLSPFELTAFHDLVSLTGSFILGLAATEAAESPEKIWNISRIDEAWQEEQWGVDDEASHTAELKRGQFQHACSFFLDCRQSRE